MKVAFDWLAENHDAIEVIVWLIGLIGIAVAIRQLIESQKQRSISETFDLVSKLDVALTIWSEAANTITVSPIEKRRELADLLSMYELICDAINRGMLTRMSRVILVNQIIDSLKIVYRHPETASNHSYLCDDPKVCSAVKIFLLNAWKRASVESHESLVETFLGSDDAALLQTGLVPFFKRRSRVAKLWWIAR